MVARYNMLNSTNVSESGVVAAMDKVGASSISEDIASHSSSIHLTAEEDDVQVGSAMSAEGAETSLDEVFKAMREKLRGDLAQAPYAKVAC